MNMDNLLCIYHGNCADGFGAAWVVRKFCSLNNIEVEFYPGVYQNAPPDVTGLNVIMVDFSYKRSVLDTMIESCKSLLILDHHKSAVSEVEFLPVAFDDWDNHRDSERNKAVALMDMERSGAGIAWDFFFPDVSRPALINHIEDRDLWRFKLPCTREIQANVFSYPYDFTVWDSLAKAPISQLISDGCAIERKHHKDVRELIQVVTREFTIGGHVVPVANLPYTLTSDAGHELAQGKPFAGCYWDTPDGRVFSLRSTDDGIDVSEIAKQYGGGGHRNSSGFRVPYGHELAR